MDKSTKQKIDVNVSTIVSVEFSNGEISGSTLAKAWGMAVKKSGSFKTTFHPLYSITCQRSNDLEGIIGIKLLTRRVGVPRKATASLFRKSALTKKVTGLLMVPVRFDELAEYGYDFDVIVPDDVLLRDMRELIVNLCEILGEEFVEVNAPS